MKRQLLSIIPIKCAAQKHFPGLSRRWLLGGGVRPEVRSQQGRDIVALGMLLGAGTGQTSSLALLLFTAMNSTVQQGGRSWVCP